MECTLNNEMNEKMVILENLEKNIKFGLITMKNTCYDIWLQIKRRNENCSSFE
jgi:hypothetical protein